jgi:hypothetical protein
MVVSLMLPKLTPLAFFISTFALSAANTRTEHIAAQATSGLSHWNI